MANNRLLHLESDILTVFFSVTIKPRLSIDNFNLFTDIPHKSIEIQMIILNKEARTITFKILLQLEFKISSITNT